MPHFFTKRHVRTAFAGLLLIGFTVPRSWAWGREGHRLTALVAESYLTPETQAQVDALLRAEGHGKETLADVAPWADAYRQEHPETAGWHYVDIPAAEAKYDRQRDCPASTTDPKSPWRDCITDRILYFEGRLGDEALSLQERAVALKFLVHLLGDIHQPFHAMGDERGGNNIAVSFLGSSQCDTGRCNLHAVWDDTMIEERHLSEPKYVALLKQEIADNHWERLNGGEPGTWANISHTYAVDAKLPNGALIRRDYYDEEIKVVDLELALGGLRLARILNRILGAPAKTGAARPWPANAAVPPR